MSEKDTIELELEKSESSGNYASRLSEADLRYARSFSENIDITDTYMVMQYGSAAQKKTVHFSESSLLDIPHSDLEEIASDIRALMKKKEAFDRQIHSASILPYKVFRQMYDPFSASLTETARRLEVHRGSLIRHSARMERLYEMCMDNIREFDLYIYAGQQCLKREQVRYAELCQKAKNSGLLEDTIRANDFKSMMERMERKLEDLKVSRNLPVQIMAQIRLIGTSDTAMADCLQKLYMDTFPLFRSRILLSYGMTSQVQNPAADTIDIHVFGQAMADLQTSLNAVLKLESSQTEKRKSGFRVSDLFGN